MEILQDFMVAKYFCFNQLLHSSQVLRKLLRRDGALDATNEG